MIQDEYLYTIKLKTSSLNRTTWATHLVKLIWSQFFKLWTLRNEQRNKPQDDGFKLHQKDILFAKVEALYLLKSKLLARDQRLMFSSCDEINTFLDTHTPSYVEQWLTIW